MKTGSAGRETRRNAADEDLRRQVAEGRPAAEMFRVVVEATPNAIVLADAQGRIVLVNAGAEKLFGYAREELIGQPVEMLLPKRFRAAHPGFRAAYAAHPETRPMGKGRDLFALRKDGSEVPVEIGLNPIETQEGPLILSSIIDITDRKRAEEDLRTTAAEFQASFYSSGVGQAQVDPATGQYLRVNPKFCEIAGYSEDELLRMSFRDLTHPDDRRDDTAAHERMVRGEAPDVNREKRYLRKDGRTVWVHINASLIRDQNGRPLRTLAVVQDITARKLAEEAHRAAEEKFRLLVEQSLVGIYIIQDERFVYVNPKTAEIHGCSLEEMTGAPVADFICDEDRTLVRENIRKRLTGVDESIRYPLRVRRRDGTLIHVEVHGGRTEYNGKPAILGTLLDITERRRAEDAMRESQQLLRAIIDNSTAVVYVKDLEGRYLLVNRRYERIFHLAGEVILGRTDHDFFPKELADAFRAVDQRVVAAGTVEEIEEIAPQDDGLHTYLSIKCPLFDATGKPYAVCGISTDITERKQAEAAIHQLNAELEQRVIDRTAELETANKELEAFSYSVSHDLRAPLRAMDGFSRVVLEDCAAQLPAEGQRCLRIIREGAQKMGALIDDLLTFSRLSRAPLKKQEVNIRSLVGSVIDDFSSQWERRQIDLRIGELPACAGDPALLRQVWINLLSNAFKYTQNREATVVEIGCERSPEGSVYFVRDNGTGFDMRYAGKLFGVFQRLHRAEEYEGTGVGLAIVQRIIHRHGGRIWADAAVDRGATFYFTLEGGTNP